MSLLSQDIRILDDYGVTGRYLEALVEVNVWWLLVHPHNRGWCLMEMIVSLEPEEAAVVVPTPYNHILQGFIYTNLDGALSRWLHDEGYRFEKRRYKMLVFGRLEGRYDRTAVGLAFRSGVRLRVRSVNADVLSSLAEFLLAKKNVRLGRSPCHVGEISLIPDPVVNASIPIEMRAVTPVVTYSTLQLPSGRKTTHYYAPMEQDWSDLIVSNLVRKAYALGVWASREVPEGAQVCPLRVGRGDEVFSSFKGTVIRGWLGTYKVALPEELFWVGYNAGFGSKNTQGFGLMEVIQRAAGNVSAGA